MTTRVVTAVALLAALALAGGVAQAKGKGKGKEKPAATAQQIEQNGFRLAVPAAWKSLPEVANNAKNGILGATTDIDGGAIAYGDTGAGVFALTLWVDAKQKVQSVRPELEAFHQGIRTSLEASGVTMTKWELAETATRITARMEGGNEQLQLRGVAVAVVDKDGHLHGWSTQCLFAAGGAKKAAPLCDAVLASFAVTVADSGLRPLEKAAKK